MQISGLNTIGAQSIGKKWKKSYRVTFPGMTLPNFSRAELICRASSDSIRWRIYGRLRSLIIFNSLLLAHVLPSCHVMIFISHFKIDLLWPSYYFYSTRPKEWQETKLWPLFPSQVYNSSYNWHKTLHYCCLLLICATCTKIHSSYAI